MILAQADITTSVIKALSVSGCLTRSGLARSLSISGDQIVKAFDEIEAAGLKLMRVRGPGGGASFIGKRMRKAD